MITNIEVKRISAHPDNPRKDLGELTELAESIKTSGILQNLTVIPWVSTISGCPSDHQQTDPLYTVVIGHRRLAAAKLAGLTEVPCVIADMNYQTQIATMLLENMQRSDLTVYEQAQGMQMMINLGETVLDIASKTGFSEGTIRRRVKLLELDGNKFKEAQDRGATLMDFAELDKVESEELKNELLKSIGTNNFRFDLQQAIIKEQIKAWETKIVEQFELFAERVDKYPAGMTYVRSYYRSNNPEIEIPEDSTEVKYRYRFESYGGVTLYKECVATAQNTEESEEEARKKEVLKEKQEKQEKLAEVTKQAFSLREDFVKSYNGAKRDQPHLLEFAVKCAVGNSYGFDTEEALELMGIESSEYDDEDEELEKVIKENVEKNIERTTLLMLYCKADDDQRNGYSTWNAHYQENHSLNVIYDCLIKLGYQMSDEEQSLRDGTHALFQEVI